MQFAHTEDRAPDKEFVTIAAVKWELFSSTSVCVCVCVCVYMRVRTLACRAACMLSSVYTAAYIWGYLFNYIRIHLIETSMCTDQILVFGVDLYKDWEECL